MAVMGIPFVFWCLLFLDHASLNSEWGGVGCFVMMCIYLFSMITGILGIVFFKKRSRIIPRIFAYLQLAAMAVDLFFLREYAVFVATPLLVLTVIYLVTCPKDAAA